jgi:adenine-specific DNA-methyltransferase
VAATPKKKQQAESYTHDDEALLRPDVGTQAQFKKKKAPKRYRYDSSLSPALDWDGQNPARELGEWLLAQIEEAAKLEPPHRFAEPRSFDGVEVAGLQDAVDRLKALGTPFLDWAGKAERLSFDVPTLPLFVHERLSTKAILETLAGHERDRQLEMQLFADPQLPLHEQLDAYEHKGGWVNRMILGDSLVVMNSLLEYEGLGGQVQMIYIDPPYGVKFGSNFQPFVRRRDVKDNDDATMTREPEMVKAYRDTWELGLHSYLSYLRDRLLVARELLTSSGSVFVQISDENVHHVRELLDEVFGAENFCSLITFRKTAGASSPTSYVDVVGTVSDYVLWYAVDREKVKYRQLYRQKDVLDAVAGMYQTIQLPTGERRRLTAEERTNPALVPAGARFLRYDNLTSSGWSEVLSQPFEYDGREFRLSGNLHWKTTPKGMTRLTEQKRVSAVGKSLAYVRFFDDFLVSPMQNLWTDTATGGFGDEKFYVVQTVSKVIQRCVLMTTDPGDLVLDPTCGSGTTAYVAEQWGRRWITIDTSRVPLALARQRLLTATFPYYDLQQEERGPGGGFVYKRRQNNKGEEVGGIVPHVTLKSIANDEPPAEEVLVDRPEVDKQITRVSGPFVVEATIPTPVDFDFDGDGEEDSGVTEDASYVDRMLEALRRNPTIQLGAGKTLDLRNVQVPAKTLSLSAEALLGEDGQPVAIVFGPENGAVSEKLVYEAAKEAHVKSYEHVIVIGFGIEPQARELVAKIEQQIGIPAVYVQATPDLVMGDLLKTMRSSQLFSVAGLPDVAIRTVDPEEKGGPQRYEVELLGLDVFDPTDFSVDHRKGDDVPAWFLDTAWNGLSFHVSQAFFPRTSAWDNLRRALKTDFDESVWAHLAGSTSAPFVAGESTEIAVKVIDDRGNELLVVKSLAEAG